MRILPVLFLLCLCLMTLTEESISDSNMSTFSIGDAVSSTQNGRQGPGLKAFFTEEEITTWSQYRKQKRLASLIAAGSVLVFYLFFFLLGINRYLKIFAERGTRWLYTNMMLIRVGQKWPPLKNIVKIFERLYGDRQWLVVLLYSLCFLTILRLVFFPYKFYRSFWYEIHHGLSNYSLGLWFLDYLKVISLGTFVYTSMVFGIYGLIARIGRRWWLFLWVGVSLAIFGWVYLAPYREMVFSDFRPLAEGELRTRLESLLQSQGVEVEGIYRMDASRRTKKANAYVTGKGPSRRIVFYDTLLENFTPREISTIMAHEIVHWKKPEKKSQYLIFSLTVFVVLFLANTVLEWGSRVRFFHYTSSRDVAGLPLLLLTFSLIFLFIRPVNLYKKRINEMETDREAVEMLCDPVAFIGAHAKLARQNHSEVDPHPVAVFLFYSHPPFLKRVETILSVNCRPEKEFHESMIIEDSGDLHQVSTPFAPGP